MVRNIIKKMIPSGLRKKVGNKLNLYKNVFQLPSLTQKLIQFSKFKKQLKRYRNISSKEVIEERDLWPFLGNDTALTVIPPHYFYQSAWLARKIKENKIEELVDVGSQTDMLAPLSAFINITFIDIRPLSVNLEGLNPVSGSVLSLPYEDFTIKCLSSLHVIEHIGLGRYGDQLDPEGTVKAAREMLRVLAKGGNLFISTPVGRERVAFNAHRVHKPSTIKKYFEPLTLIEFSVEDDKGNFIRYADLYKYENANYSCGMFWFRKE